MTHTFRITGNFYKDKTFPDLNDYLHECGKHPQAGARMKRDYMQIASTFSRNALRRFHTDKRVFIHYIFVEPCKGRLRDHSNVAAFAIKVIEDSMTQCGFINDDSPKYIVGYDCKFGYTDAEPYIEVTINELEESA